MRVIIYDTEELNNDELFFKEYELVTEQRRSKIDRIKNRSDRNMSLGAGILEREYADGWKHHNLSHSHGMAVIALSDRMVGTDIEPVRTGNTGNTRNTRNIKIAKRFFCPEETEYVLKAGDEGFFRIWTLKEAFMKATGRGMALGLDSFCIDVSGKDIAVRQNFDDGGWIFSEFRQNEFLVAVCGKESVEKMEGFVL